jgi:hypothetical protein
MGIAAATATDALTDAPEALKTDRVTYLQGLGDPDLIRLWGELRCSLTRAGPDTKSLYDAVLAEYRRRIDGGMARTA